MTVKEEFIISGDGEDISIVPPRKYGKNYKKFNKTEIKNSNFMKLFEFVLSRKRCALSHQLSRTCIQLSVQTSFSNGCVRSH